MDIPDQLIAHGRRHANNPFVLRAAIDASIAHHEAEARRLGTTALARDSLASMRRSYDSLYGLCSLHCEQEFRRELTRTPFWRRRKLRRTEHEWTAQHWLTLEEQARQEINTLIKGVGTPTPTP